ncbi:TIGR03084 family protein [Virgisporangium aliadipatigenens]|uniref:TIGR03084 family protein n=1 Tax=Virgisporangium aliadipatigenens TaxID=741659 RepID=A0A8J3YWW3_9ACTN|nr:TIGR03084 family metal-binding protein [Virgisporangium aliadipatigenens]GIJ52187.1 TIGR03084 family protein [Virgisporangium aliadipatigenens]
MLDDVLPDLEEESADLDRTVAALSDADLVRPTPSPGWTIAHQIAHLAWLDGLAILAITDAAGFAAEAATADASYVDRAAADGIGPRDELLPRWRHGRAELARLLRGATGRIPWFGPPMTPATMATARLMETWAHGQDVADALGVRRGFTRRLRHVAFLGHRTLGYSFLVHGLPAPEEPVRVELATPEGELWAFGPAGAVDRVAGPALDFCLLVTQRRHRADLALQATGPVAERWLTVAQAFAGPPGAKREPQHG